MRASDLTSDTIHYVAPDDTIAHVKHQFIQRRLSALPVLDGTPIGTISDTELSTALYEHHQPVDELLVSKLMRKDIVKANPDLAVEAIAKLLIDKKTKLALLCDEEEETIRGIMTKTELTSHFIRNYPGQATVEDLMSKEVETINRFHSVFQAAKRMAEKGIDKLVVREGNEVAGIMTARDIALASYGQHNERGSFGAKDNKHIAKIKPLTVEDIMHAEVSTIPAKSDAASAAKLMLENKIGSAVAMDDGELAGIITKRDILRFLAEKA